MVFYKILFCLGFFPGGQLRDAGGHLRLTFNTFCAAVSLSAPTPGRADLRIPFGFSEPLTTNISVPLLRVRKFLRPFLWCSEPFTGDIFTVLIKGAQICAAFGLEQPKCKAVSMNSVPPGQPCNSSQNAPLPQSAGGQFPDKMSRNATPGGGGRRLYLQIASPFSLRSRLRKFAQPFLISSTVVFLLTSRDAGTFPPQRINDSADHQESGDDCSKKTKAVGKFGDVRDMFAKVIPDKPPCEHPERATKRIRQQKSPPIHLQGPRHYAVELAENVKETRECHGEWAIPRKDSLDWLRRFGVTPTLSP